MATGSDYIGGHFTSPSAPEAELVIRSPADLDDVVGVHPVSRGQVDEAVASARAAMRAWRRTPFVDRAQRLRAYQSRLKAHAEALATTIAREVGKPRWEARAEVQAMVSKVDVTLTEGMRFVEDVRLPDVPGEIRHRPLGVLAVLGPFNFPGHLPNGQLVPALACGNTVVFKPSDKAPGTAAWMARCFDEAGFPPGVVNVVQGGVPVAQHLSTHAGLDGLLFTGSLEVGRALVAANAHRPGLLVALELGGKNASLVLADCDVERTARELAFSGYATAGQRCTATSRVLVVREVAQALVERLAAAARRAVVGHVLDEGAFLGPVISEASRARLAHAQGLARGAGFQAVVPGGEAHVEGRRGWYVRPALHVAQGPLRVAGYTDVELFGPDLAVQVVDSLEEAVAAANEGPFGLSASVYTASAEAFEDCAHELEVGVVHWNRSSAGASGRLPFGGIKASGNHRPAGVMMSTSCAFPQAVLKPAPQPGPLPTWPGLSFE